MITNFYQLLAGIEKRPLLYLTKKSINNLWDFYLGYRSGYESGVEHPDLTPNPEEIEDFFNFNGWLRRYYTCDSVTMGWGIMILQHSESEEQAFNIFFELFRRFLMGERPPANPVSYEDFEGENWIEEYLAKRAKRQTSWWDEYQAGFNLR